MDLTGDEAVDTENAKWLICRIKVFVGEQAKLNNLSDEQHEELVQRLISRIYCREITNNDINWDKILVSSINGLTFTNGNYVLV